MTSPQHQIRSVNNFDILRFVSACFVIITHWYALTGIKMEEDILMKISNNSITLSTLGLKIFFIISGYLITKSVISSPTYTDYILKRALRIYPGLFVSLLFCILVIGPLFTTLPLKDYITNKETWFFLQNMDLLRIQWTLPGVFETHTSTTVMGSIWTLIYEVMMYIGLLFAAMLGIIKKRIIMLCCFVLIYLGYLYTVFFSISNKFRFYLIYTDLDLHYTINFALFFMAGSLFFLYKDKIKYTNISALIVFILWVASWYLPENYMMQTASFIFIPYLTFWFAYCPQLSFFNNFGKYGDFSYGIYIYGMPVQQALIALLGANYFMPALMAYSIIISLILAYFSWTLVEKPALQLIKRRV